VSKIQGQRQAATVQEAVASIMSERDYAISQSREGPEPASFEVLGESLMIASACQRCSLLVMRVTHRQCPWATPSTR